MCKRRVQVVILAAIVAVSFGCTSISQRALLRAKRSYAQQNYGDMFQVLWHAAPYGDPAVEYALGYCYYTGMGIRENYVVARYYFYQAAKQSYPPAIKALALLTPQDPAFTGWQHGAGSSVQPMMHRAVTSGVSAKERPVSAALPIPGHRDIKRTRARIHMKKTQRVSAPSAASSGAMPAPIPVPRPALPVPPS